MEDKEILNYERSINKLQAPGSLYIVSIPVGESIYIDNVLQTGVNTPITIIGLSAGSHTYKLTLSGYQDTTGSFSIVSGQTVNVLVINKDSLTLDGTHTYDYVNIANGGKLYITAYDGTGTTGTLILNVTEINVDSTSSIIGTARGYRGGAGGSGGSGGKGGEPVGFGGGSDGSTCNYPCSGVGSGGGGGGYGTIGGNGGGVYVNPTYKAGGIGGIINGTSNGYDINMGSGGGGGSSFSGWPSGNNGSSGGGMLTINANNINIHGIINFNGGDGGDGGSYGGACCYDGGGGGASGGGILFSTTNINITGATITSNGGNGGANGALSPRGRYGYADIGGGGRIKIFYSGTLINTGATVSAGTVTLIPIITATTMTVTPSNAPCIIGTCTATVDVTWTNQGNSSWAFIPNISIDGIPISPSPFPAEPLAVGANITHSFSVTGLSAAVHTICPYPN